jgi:hypothetical protein
MHIACAIYEKKTYAILLPLDLVRKIDATVGPRGRSAFLTQTARDAVRRQTFCGSSKAKHLPGKTRTIAELAHGSAEWTRGMREESEIHDNNRKQRRRKKNEIAAGYDGAG